MTTTNQLSLERSLEASIIGFHNPKKHKGLTDKAFLELYMFRLKTSRKPIHPTYLAYLLAHEAHFLLFIRKTLLRRKRVF